MRKQIEGGWVNDYGTLFRPYEGGLGRWSSQDPMMRSWATPYEGMGSLPTMMTDPLGLEPVGDGGGYANRPYAGESGGGGGPTSGSTAPPPTTNAGSSQAADMKAAQAPPMPQHQPSILDKAGAALKGAAQGIGRIFITLAVSLGSSSPEMNVATAASPEAQEIVRDQQKKTYTGIAAGTELIREHVSGDFQGPYHLAFYEAKQKETDRYQEMTELEKWEYGGQVFGPVALEYLALSPAVRLFGRTAGAAEGAGARTIRMAEQLESQALREAEGVAPSAIGRTASSVSIVKKCF